MATNRKGYEDRIISGTELAACFDNLKEHLGRAMIETITYELEVMFGIVAVGRLSYRLSQIEDALTKLLGDSASEIMMESIIKHFDMRKK